MQQELRSDNILDTAKVESEAADELFAEKASAYMQSKLKLDSVKKTNQPDDIEKAVREYNIAYFEWERACAKQFLYRSSYQSACSGLSTCQKHQIDKSVNLTD